jgi:hypothetical protein
LTKSTIIVNNLKTYAEVLFLKRGGSKRRRDKI